MKIVGSADSSGALAPRAGAAQARRAFDAQAVDRQPEIVAVAHQQQRRDVVHRVREAEHAVAPIGRAERQRAITSRGIVSQYDVVCICCSGRSSSPEPTFSFV